MGSIRIDLDTWKRKSFSDSYRQHAIGKIVLTLSISIPHAVADGIH